MPVIYQSWITRQDLVNNRDKLYLFGDNEQRAGLGGQAKAMRGEPNAVGIRTKRYPNNNLEAFWQDYEYERCIKLILEDFSRPINHIKQGGVVIIPKDGIGTNRALLSVNAPRILNYIQSCINILENWRVEVT